MGSVSSGIEPRAISPALANGSGKSTTLGSESEDLEWFAHAAWTLLGKDAGQRLHYLTGYPESSCYAYVAHDPTKRRKPPGHFLRKLFHSRQGEPFFNAFMDGCTSQWWRDLQRAKRITAAIDCLDLT